MQTHHNTSGCWSLPAPWEPHHTLVHWCPGPSPKVLSAFGCFPSDRRHCPDLRAWWPHRSGQAQTLVPGRHSPATAPRRSPRLQWRSWISKAFSRWSRSCAASPQRPYLKAKPGRWIWSKQIQTIHLDGFDIQLIRLEWMDHSGVCRV